MLITYTQVNVFFQKEKEKFFLVLLLELTSLQKTKNIWQYQVFQVRLLQYII